MRSGGRVRFGPGRGLCFEHLTEGTRARLDRVIRDAATRNGGRALGDLRTLGRVPSTRRRVRIP